MYVPISTPYGRGGGLYPSLYSDPAGQIYALLNLT